MAVRRSVTTLTFAGLISASATARAQAFSANPTATATGGYATSRIIPNDPAGVTTYRYGPFIAAGGGLKVTYETPRTDQTLQLDVQFTLPLTRDFTFVERPPLYNGRLDYVSHIALSELMNLTLGLAASALPLNPFVNAIDAFSTPVDAGNTDVGYNLSTNGHEVLTRELSPTDRLTQTTNLTFSYPFNVTPSRASTLHLNNSLALTHSWPFDTGALAFAVGYTHFGASTVHPGRHEQLLNTLIATWTRPLTPALTSSVDLGVLQAISLGATAAPIWQPTGGARLTYHLELATASLNYTHGAAVNIFTASVNLHDQVSLRGAIPLADTGAALSLTAGYVHSQPITAEGTLDAASHIFIADADLTYTPPQVPKLAASLRGAYNRQIGVDDPLLGFTRLSLTLHLSYSFPSAQAAAIQRRIAPAYTPTPVLGSDSTPAPGVQPTPVEVDDAAAEEREAAEPTAAP